MLLQAVLLLLMLQHGEDDDVGRLHEGLFVLHVEREDLVHLQATLLVECLVILEFELLVLQEFELVVPTGI